MSAALALVQDVQACPDGQAEARWQEHPAYEGVLAHLDQHAGRRDPVIASILFWKVQKVHENPRGWAQHQANTGDVSVTVTYTWPETPHEPHRAIFNVPVETLTVPLWAMLNTYAAGL
jgi:hypothetical protein